jgi:Holliday junction resolvasome RuvABC ATP-dependent DNA helicase subunit
MSFMNVQNVMSALVNSKGIIKNSYEPYLVQQTIFFLSPSMIQIW